MKAHRRHDISDKAWSLLERHLPGRMGSWGGVAQDNRQFINAVFWILRTWSPWRGLPPIMVIGATGTGALFVGGIKGHSKSF